MSICIELPIYIATYDTHVKSAPEQAQVLQTSLQKRHKTKLLKVLAGRPNLLIAPYFPSSKMVCGRIVHDVGYTIV